jgi:3-hydroxyisobutyrate dehydrogenase-like beta-hydroxyacid dehydrogenase
MIHLGVEQILLLLLLFLYVEQLVFGNSGVLQGISSGKAYVDMSTVDLETISDVCEVSRCL